MTQTIADILTLERTQLGAHCTSKKRLLEHVSDFLSGHIADTTADEIYDNLITREKLGSTGIGEGIAIPHSRLRQCVNTVGALFLLDEAIDFDAIDRQPVDLIFVLLVPEEATEEHLKTLSMLATLFNDPNFRSTLRHANDTQNLYDLAIQFKVPA